MVFKKAFPLILISYSDEPLDHLLSTINEKLFTRVVWISTTKSKPINTSHINALSVQTEEGDEVSIDRSKLAVEVWNNNKIINGFSFALCIEILNIVKKSVTIRISCALNQSDIFDINYYTLKDILAADRPPNFEVIFSEIYHSRSCKISSCKPFFPRLQAGALCIALTVLGVVLIRCTHTHLKSVSS